MAGIVSRTTAKAFLQLNTPDEDGLIDLLIGYADAAIKHYCYRDFESTTYPGAAQNGQGDSGYYNGESARFIRLRQRPVTAISAIYLDMTGRFGQNPDGSFDATTSLLINGTDYVLHYDGCLPSTTTKCSYSGIVERVNGLWPANRFWAVGQITPMLLDTPGNIKVAYTAGWTTIPSDLELAACQIIAFMRRNNQAGVPLQSENLGGYSYSAASVSGAPELSSTRQILNRYREVQLVGS